MATHNISALAGGSGGSNLLPRNVSSEIWDLAKERTIIPALSRSTSIILGENTFPTITKRPSASIVGEGANKPDSELEVGSKTIRPVKSVVGLEFTMEAILTNPAGVLGLLQTELGEALARQIDLAILHGREASSGAALTGGHEFINQTTNRVSISGAASHDAALWEGYGKIVDKGGRSFTGLALDPRFVYQLANDRDQHGNRRNPDIQIGSAVTSYAGQPVAVTRGVSGQIDNSVDTKVRGFGGDWDALGFGYVLDIPVKRIEYGDPFGNGDLQRRNSVAYLAEIIFGWVVHDIDSFVAYDQGTPSGS